VLGQHSPSAGLCTLRRQLPAGSGPAPIWGSLFRRQSSRRA